MNVLHLKQLEIINNLSYIPPDRLDDILKYMKKLIDSAKPDTSKIQTLWGAWSDITADSDVLENNLYLNRKKQEANLLKKYIFV